MYILMSVPFRSIQFRRSINMHTNINIVYQKLTVLKPTKKKHLYGYKRKQVLPVRLHILPMQFVVGFYVAGNAIENDMRKMCA